ncbi:MAG: aminotransferase class IV [Phycisphaerae bacterium]|nr:aminotransferase class IV [Phycisphaerae bacterium]
MLAYVNGTLVAQDKATVSVFDRGFLFGDGVYEMVRYFDGYGVALDLHTARLARSLKAMRIEGFDAGDLETIGRDLLKANSLADGSIYLQVTRGAGTSRAHMPAPGMTPTVVAFATATAPLAEFTQPERVAAIVRPDPRWKHCSIKTISLAGNILCLMEAQAAGADECILTRDGLVGEGAYTNVAVVRDGRMTTCALDDHGTPVLHGTMRAWAFECAAGAGIACEEGRVREGDLRTADEVLIMSSRRLVSAVTSLDGDAVGSGAVGPVCRALFSSMHQRIACAVRARRSDAVGV